MSITGQATMFGGEIIRQTMERLLIGDAAAANDDPATTKRARDADAVPQTTPRRSRKPIWREKRAEQPLDGRAQINEMPRFRFGDDQAGRDYLMFTPDRPARRPGLVVMLHGCTQDAADFALGTGMNAAAGSLGFHVIYPEQPEGANSMRCWNWFDPENQKPDSGEPAILAGLIGDAMRRAGLTKADVFLAGLSAGGAMAATLADLNADRVLAVGVHSGLPAGAASTVAGAMRVMRRGAEPGDDSGVPMIVFHGDDDRTVTPENGEALAAHIGQTVKSKGRERKGLAWTARKGPGGEYWQVEGLGHAWSGGDAAASHTDPRGPDASGEMMRFFMECRDRTA